MNPYNCVKCGDDLPDGWREGPSACGACAESFYIDNGFEIVDAGKDDRLRALYEQWLKNPVRRYRECPCGEPLRDAEAKIFSVCAGCWDSQYDDAFVTIQIPAKMVRKIIVGGVLTANDLMAIRDLVAKEYVKTLG